MACCGGRWDRPGPGSGGARALIRRPQSPAVRLFLTATSILFAELLLIRWIPANVIYVGFFSNFLLMASFLGIGLGILWGRDPRRTPISPFGPLLLSLVLLVVVARVSIYLDSPDEIFALGASRGADTNFIILPLLVILATVVMAGLAVPLGPLLTSMPPLRAYALDILGSMTGVALFTLLSAAGTPPIVWFAALAIIASALGVANGLSRASAVTAGSLAGVVLVIAASAAPNQTWSPYYRIDEYESGGITAVDVNGIPHQAMHPTDGFLEPVLRAGVPLVPGSDIRPGSHRRRRQRDGCRRGARAWRGPHRCRRDRPGDPGHRGPRPPRPPLRRPPGHANRRRRSRVPPAQRRPLRPRGVRPSRLAHPGEHVGEPAARVVPVHRRGVPRGPRSPGR